MKPRYSDIRVRLFTAALLPLAVLGVLMSALVLLGRSDDLQTAHQQRMRSVARQIAAASEYGLFSGNQSQLTLIANGALREPDVRLVIVLGPQGQVMATAGEVRPEQRVGLSTQEQQGRDQRLAMDWVSQPVLPAGVPLDDVYEDPTTPGLTTAAVLGQVVLYSGREQLLAQQQRMLVLTAAVSAVGLAFGLLLALRLSQGVLRPILRVKHQIERIGHGDFEAVSAGPAVALNDPLAELQQPLQDMADKLARSRQSLEQQVAEVTQALREKMQEAEHANRAKSRFLAAASHDLRQPTHALGLFVTRLAQLTHDDDSHVLIGQLEASVRAMQNLLDDLLDVSRLDAGSIQAQPKPMALAPLLQQLGLDAQSAARAKGLRLRLRIPPSSLWVHSDASLVYRILLNLVSNAIRYTEVGGVLVSARRVQAGRQVKLQVWDTGVGIAPEHQQAVFTEFFQVDNPGRDRRLGLGLGLNIVQRTALLLGLPLSLRSQPGRGTCITLLLPASDTSQIGATATPEPVIAPQDVLVGVRVLVVEDDSLSAQALVGLLQDWGMQVRLAPSGAQALRVVAQGWHPDLLVSDCRLPDTHGIALVQGLRRQLGESLRACLISGDTDPGVLAQAQLRELTLLHKPVRPAKLRALLSRLLQTQRTTGTLP